MQPETPNANVKTESSGSLLRNRVQSIAFRVSMRGSPGGGARAARDSRGI
jgi:hypothetical protein